MTPTEAGSAVRPSVPLSRNRDYNVLWISRLVSELGSELALIGFPLLILATTRSAVEIGLVATTMAVALLLGSVPAGYLADRFDRKVVMVVCEALRAVAMASVAVALYFDAYSLPHILVVAAIDGLLVSVFGPAEDAALPSVVAPEQLSQAVARNTARPYLASLAGPLASGVLFTVDHMLPFALNAAMLILSCIALLTLRLPKGASPAVEDEQETGEPVGLRWVWQHRPIRTTLIWVALVQLVFSALVVIILAVSGEDQVGPGEIGVMMACFGAGGLIGAALAARLHDALPASVIIIGFSWLAAVLIFVMAFTPGGVLLGVVLGVVAMFMPVTVTTVMTYQMSVTADELRGRLSGLVGLFTGAAGALGPVAGGALASGDGTTGLMACAAAAAVIAVGATLSPTLRRFPAPGRQAA
ncbi:putative MFS family arabinose efflux permease [Lentzea atacamensis]|uniref:Putative MFS family arabinose efflux permease n=1 Tax=Lentzea atacamensis TaxID=531938 RepID=A0A316IGA7_9PSEU|nr:MFS transporter [Lentzea atacamensis]PWK86302.1 putative MFS family arabinose efflux permease [Lentzea atacamensis]